MVLLGATVAALLWANSPWSDSYESLWTTKLAITVGDGSGISTDLRHWVNEGLMTFFFLVIGLEAKREIDLGKLRERRRLAIPAFAAIGGMVVPVAIYLAFNAGGSGAHGWGAAMSTEATELSRSFREQPTPELARSARQGVLSVISPNERLQHGLHPWTSYVIVPLFALANAGVHVTGPLLRDAAGSPITLGILVGYVVGKPLGITGASWLASRPWLGGPRSPLSGPLLAAGGAVAGVGFTISLLISSKAFTGQQLDEARLGALATVIAAPLVAWIVLRIVRRLPEGLRARQIAGTADDLLDLAQDVDPERDHIRGPEDAPVTLLVRRLRVPVLRPG